MRIEKLLIPVAASLLSLCVHAQTPSGADLGGSYACIYSADGRVSDNIVNLYKDDWTGIFKLHNFLGKGTDINVRVLKDEASGTSVLAIAGGGQTTLYSENGQNYDLFLAYRDEAGKIWTLPGDLEFAMGPADVSLALPESNMAVVCLNQSTLKYTAFDFPEFYRTNGWAQVITEDASTGSPAQKEYAVYGLKTDNSLYVYGFFDYPYPLLFNLNPTAGMARALEQTAWSYEGEDFVFVNISTREPVLYGTYTDEPNEFSLILSDDWMTYNERYGVKDKGYNTEFSFNMSQNAPDTDGIGAMSTVESENESAVYYDLSGVRVASPSEKGIYIERRGNKASKIIVK